MKHFCTKCGKPTIYALALPKFCSQCGSEFSLVTKEKNKSAHDQALEKSKEKYTPNHQRNEQPLVPVNKPDVKQYPNPARASFTIINDHEIDETQEQQDDYYQEDDFQHIDASRFRGIKPKFKLHQIGSSSESFESLITQSYASNYKPSDPQEIRGLTEESQQRSANSVLEEFKREAGSIRGSQQ